MQRSDMSLATRFINHARNYTEQFLGKSEFTKWLGLSDEALLAVSDSNRNFAWFAHVISRCPAYKIDPDLYKRADEFRHKLVSKPGGFDRLKQSIIDHPELLRAPFPVLWLEFETNALFGKGTRDRPEKLIKKPSRTGALIFNLPSNGGLRVYQFECLKDEPMISPNPGQIIYFEQTSKMKFSLIFEDPFMDKDENARQNLQNFRVTTLQTLIFLKSRASLLKFEGLNEGKFAK